jgi:hypothetical protein
MSLNIFHISDNIADQINDALTNALESAYVSSHDVSTGAIEEYIDQLVEEAIEKDREERKAEAPFTYQELVSLRAGVHRLRMEQFEIDAGKNASFNRFGNHEKRAEFEAWAEEEKKKLQSLYEKVDELINASKAK